MEIEKGQKIILFDGECNLCNGFINFVIDRDLENIYVFAALQSSIGIELLKSLNTYSSEIDSIILIDKESKRIERKSLAAISIIGGFGGYWRLIKLFKIFPVFINDIAYDYVAKNRYRWFGKSACRIPTPDLLEKFLR